ncbi:hypothetical protein LEP1GSC193_3804 [Leptospira alstonii serovar Pingchang str. 80-412]|uniref:Uncharacterized protein n=2 Tax=Leptospira alstonii TaxID=28452 RepID=M6CYZ0_9LEPT|nr:hypothetical protein LEP1GSC194_3097 [Leptospira alstonii serovar Sichuan str. 79601]EQA80680.1 hypothetical protein LEP1GSC193_3804 [Leptospira alstonii serovar Pingchang str. 80-412]
MKKSTKQMQKIFSTLQSSLLLPLKLIMRYSKLVLILLFKNLLLAFY